VPGLPCFTCYIIYECQKDRPQKLNMGASKRKQEKTKSATAHKKPKVSGPKIKSKRSKRCVPPLRVAKSEEEDEEEESEEEESEEVDNSDDEEDDEEEKFGGIEDEDQDGGMDLDDKEEKSKNPDNGTTSGCEPKKYIRLF